MNPRKEEDLDFAVFVLSHAGCGDGSVELRIGDRWLIEWCPTCAVLETFFTAEF